jgi:hypothetical protein
MTSFAKSASACMSPGLATLGSKFPALACIQSSAGERKSAAPSPGPMNVPGSLSGAPHPPKDEGAQNGAGRSPTYPRVTPCDACHAASTRALTASPCPLPEWRGDAMCNPPPLAGFDVIALSCATRRG